MSQDRGGGKTVVARPGTEALGRDRVDRGEFKETVNNGQPKTGTCHLPPKGKILVAQSCPTLCDPMDYSPPGSSVHEILQTRILEWVAISFSGGCSRPKDQTWVSCIAGVTCCSILIPSAKDCKCHL